VFVGVTDAVTVGVGVSVGVTVGVGVSVGVTVGVIDAVGDGFLVTVGVGVGVTVAVTDGVIVGVILGVTVLDGVGVGVKELTRKKNRLNNPFIGVLKVISSTLPLTIFTLFGVISSVATTTSLLGSVLSTSE
jgi:hypothetical protein